MTDARIPNSDRVVRGLSQLSNKTESWIRPRNMDRKEVEYKR